MASVKLSIHIPDDASSSPDTALKLVNALAKIPQTIFETSKELQEYLMETQGTPNRSEIVANAKNLGILAETTDGLRMSNDGLALARVRDDARCDLLHFLFYAGWSPQNPSGFLQSWGYRCVCDQFWAMGTVELTTEYINQLVGDIINIATSTFSALNVGEFDEISFSDKSIRGVRKWLEPLQPAVIQGKIFKRRNFCTPELVMMAIRHVLEGELNATGVDILLSPSKREAISKICLLEPDALDRALDWAIPIFSDLATPGTTAGFYGRFIRLHKLPTLEDVVR